MQLGTCGPAGGRLAGRGRRHEAQEDAAGDLPALPVECQVGLLGTPSERAQDAADGLVALARHAPPAAALEEVGERVLQEREPAGPAGDVADDLAGQTGLQRDPDRRRGALDRPLQLVAREGRDELRAGSHELSELPGAEQAVEVVRPHGSHDEEPAVAGGETCGEGREEARSLLFVRDEGEQLLELVDHEEQARGSLGARRGERVAGIAGA